VPQRQHLNHILYFLHDVEQFFLERVQFPIRDAVSLDVFLYGFCGLACFPDAITERLAAVLRLVLVQCFVVANAITGTPIQKPYLSLLDIYQINSRECVPLPNPPKPD